MFLRPTLRSVRISKRAAQAPYFPFGAPTVNGIQLGAFQLVTQIGRGGMGEVWLGEHLEDGRQVAIKVLTARRATDRRYRRSFRNEARAVAGLDHPNIVDIFDFGELSAEAVISSGNRYRAGTQYMVMELVRGGTLSGHRTKLQWPQFKTVLLSLLDALAHAHAREVIHRDLKPGNVLFGAGGSSIKLTDFGLAHAVNREGVTMDTPRAHIGGTPAYMAPEQFYGNNRDVGPWSDLYALGCLVHTMVRGSPPFGRKPWLEVANGHLYRKTPKLLSQIVVPDGFEDWVAGLLEKNPADRYRRAADAAWDLHELEDPTEEFFRPSQSESVSIERLRAPSGLTDSSAMESAPHSQTTLVWGGRETLIPIPELKIEERELRRGPAPKRPPPLPVSWRRPADISRTESRIGGTGLFVHRTLAMVDRETERSALWSALRSARQDGRVRVVLVRGGAGCGKTRLAEWLCQRAHEMGGAQVLRAVHSPIATRADGLGAMLQRYVRCAGLQRDEVVERVVGSLASLGIDDDARTAALTEIVSPVSHAQRISGIGELKFSTASERHAVMRWFLTTCAARRPLVLWLEDVQWGLDALEFVETLLDDGRHQPILVLMTARDEDLPPASLESLVLAGIVDRPGAEVLPLRGLSPADSQELIRDRLGLDPDLAAVVEARTEGNPQFAVRLVSDWIGRGVMERGSRGWRLSGDEPIEIPDDLHEAWSHTIDRLLAARREDDGVALELAAVIGTEVHVAEWKAVCGAATIRPSSSLLDAVLNRRLGHSKDPEVSWRFAHGMVRESLLRRARDAGRWQAHHRICAARLSGDLDLLQTERLARHLSAAGDDRAALEPMRRAAAGYIETAEFRAAQAMLVELEQAMERISLPQTDLAWARAWVLRARLYRQRREQVEAKSYADRAVEVARVARHGATLFEALRERGLLEVLGGEFVAANDVLSEARALAQRLGNRRAFAEVSMDLGWVAMQRGQLDVAEERFLRCVALFDALDDGPAAAGVWMGLSDLARKAGRWRVAIERAQRGRVCWEAQGARSGVARAINMHADILRLTGELTQAEEGFRDAVARFDQLGIGKTAIARVNLALVLIARERYGEAEEILGAFLEVIHPSRVSVNAIVHASLTPCAAAARDWESMDRHLKRAIALAGSVGYVDTDLADGFQRSAELCQRAGQWVRAKNGYEQALEQWVAMRRRDKIEEVRTALSKL